MTDRSSSSATKRGTPIVHYGGLWDRTAKDFGGPASRSMIFELHGAQVEAILLFDPWMDEHYRGPDPEVLARVRDIIEQNLAFDAELGAARDVRAVPHRKPALGKTFLMEAILCSYAVVGPDSISRAGDPAAIVRL